MGGKPREGAASTEEPAEQMQEAQHVKSGKHSFGTEPQLSLEDSSLRLKPWDWEVGSREISLLRSQE